MAWMKRIMAGVLLGIVGLAGSPKGDETTVSLETDDVKLSLPFHVKDVYLHFDDEPAQRHGAGLTLRGIVAVATASSDWAGFIYKTFTKAN